MTFSLELDETFCRVTNPQSPDPKMGSEHVLNSLVRYLNRYEPTQKEVIRHRIERELAPAQQGSFLLGAAVYLIDFIYDRICYQRMQSVATMLRFCKDSSRDSEKARQAIINYFDRSEFSDALEDMRQRPDDFSNALELIDQIGDFSKAEQLFWECRRLLDETPRDDWRLIALSCDLFIGRSSLEDFAKVILNEFSPGSLGDCVMIAVRIVNRLAAQTDHIDPEQFALLLLEPLYSREETRPLALHIAGRSTNSASQESLVGQHLLNLQIGRLLNVTRKQ